MTFKKLLEENIKPNKYRIPNNYPVKCENNNCNWKGIISNCNIEMDSEGWEYPEYEILCCPKCGDYIDI